jgi:hypothetical protein
LRRRGGLEFPSLRGKHKKHRDETRNDTAKPGEVASLYVHGQLLSTRNGADPDHIIVVETVADWCGVGLITREMKERLPFIKVRRHRVPSTSSCGPSEMQLFRYAEEIDNLRQSYILP